MILTPCMYIDYSKRAHFMETFLSQKTHRSVRDISVYFFPFRDPDSWTSCTCEIWYL